MPALAHDKFLHIAACVSTLCALEGASPSMLEVEWIAGHVCSSASTANPSQMSQTAEAELGSTGSTQRLTIGSHMHYYHFRMVLPLAGQLPMLYTPQQLLYSIACGAAQLNQRMLQ